MERSSVGSLRRLFDCPRGATLWLYRYPDIHPPGGRLPSRRMRQPPLMSISPANDGDIPCHYPETQRRFNDDAKDNSCHLLAAMRDAQRVAEIQRGRTEVP